MMIFTFIFRYQQYISNSGRNLPDRDCMVQQEYEVDVEETYEPEKVSYDLLVTVKAAPHEWVIRTGQP